MIVALLKRLHQEGNLQSFFYMGEFALGAIFVTVVWFLRPQSPETHFRVRESDLKKSDPKGLKKNQPGLQTLAEARIQKKEILRLNGIRIDGLPHEILGVSSQASPQEIQQAYRNLMKQYHPDRIGTQGSREWNDAQKIAEAINHAKDVMLKKR